MALQGVEVKVREGGDVQGNASTFLQPATGKRDRWKFTFQVLINTKAVKVGDALLRKP